MVGHGARRRTAGFGREAETYERSRPSYRPDALRGVSHVAALPPQDHARVVADVQWVLDTHPATRGCTELRIPYRVECLWAERR